MSSMITFDYLADHWGYATSGLDALVNKMPYILVGGGGPKWVIFGHLGPISAIFGQKTKFWGQKQGFLGFWLGQKIRIFGNIFTSVTSATTRRGRSDAVVHWDEKEKI